MAIQTEIFKSYDIRGLVDSQLSDELAYRLGRAFVQFLRGEGASLSDKKIVVGRDMRPSSVGFQEALVRGLVDSGASVVEVGLVSTPLFNFACAHYSEHVGGIMVTASHNPAEYNGFKLTRGNGLPIGKGSGMEEIRDAVVANEFGDTSENVGQVTEMSVLGDYIQHIFSIVPVKEIKPLKVVIDYGNGMGSVSVPTMLEQLPVEVVSLYETPDGTFPNHEANPLKVETLKDLQAKVLAEQADFGFALDGDADRIGLVDEQGEVVEASYVGALIGLEVLKRHPGSKMLYDLRESMIVPEVWSAAGASSVEKSMVGHAHIKKMMKDTGAAYASELSLHLYYQDTYDVESTDLSLLYVLQLLSREGKALSELVAPLKKYHHSGEINFEVEDKDSAIARVREHFAGAATEVSGLDGLWMGFDWGWLNVRASNTELVLRLNLEVRDGGMLDEKVKEVSGVITQK